MEISGEDVIDDDYRVGFHYDDYEEDDFYEIDGDYIDLSTNKKTKGRC